MDHKTLVAACATISTTFTDIPSSPAPLDLAAGTGAGEVVRRYRRHGFAVFGMGETLGADVHRAASARLHLGAPFVPPLYSLGGQEPDPISTISAARNVDRPDASHPSFGRTVGQALHCDGTLQTIGFVKATLMSCVHPAARGGANVFFNSSGAFLRLVELDPEAALALTDPRALARRATINGCSDVTVGPAFSVQESGVLARYCVTETDSWRYDSVADPEGLRRGVAFLEGAAEEGSPFHHEQTLSRDLAVVFDNTVISHGRMPYEDSESAQRCMLRTLHLSHPRVHGGEGIVA